MLGEGARVNPSSVPAGEGSGVRSKQTANLQQPRSFRASLLRPKELPPPFFPFSPRYFPSAKPRPPPANTIVFFPFLPVLLFFPLRSATSQGPGDSTSALPGDSCWCARSPCKRRFHIQTRERALARSLSPPLPPPLRQRETWKAQSGRGSAVIYPPPPFWSLRGFAG